MSSSSDQPREVQKKKPSKNRVTSILTTTFSNNRAFQIIASSTSTQIASCFPSFNGDRLIRGSVLAPSADAFQELLASESKEETTTQSSTPEAIRDTVLAGAIIGSAEVLEGCLKNGADLTLRDPEGRHILHYLAATGNASLLRKVLRRLEKTHGGKSKTKAGESFASLLNAQDNYQWTPLAIAIARRNDEAVEAFLSYSELDIQPTMEHNCPPSRIDHPAQYGPLHLAAMCGRVSVMFRLIEKGCKIDALDSHGRTIYHYLAALSDHDMCLQCLDGITQDSRFVPSHLAYADNDNRTPLFLAIGNGNLGLAERLLFLLRQEQSEEFATHYILHKDEIGMTGLHMALMRGHHSMLFRAYRLWVTFAGDGDKSNICDDEVLFDTLLSTFNDEWVLGDLNFLEKTAFDVLRSGFSIDDGETGKLLAEQLAKAVRFCGVEVSLNAFRVASDMERRGEFVMASHDRRRTLQGVFYKILEENVPGHIWNPLMVNNKLSSIPNLFTAPTKSLNMNAPLRQTQSAVRHLRAPGFAGPRAGSAGRSSSVSATRPNLVRKEVTSPRVPPMAHTHNVPLSPPSRRGTVTATTQRPPVASTLARGPSFAMPTKSVTLRGGRVDRKDAAAVRSASRSARGLSKGSPSARATHRSTNPDENEKASKKTQSGDEENAPMEGVCAY